MPSWCDGEDDEDESPYSGKQITQGDADEKRHRKEDAERMQRLREKDD